MVNFRSLPYVDLRLPLLEKGIRKFLTKGKNNIREIRMQYRKSVKSVRNM